MTQEPIIRTVTSADAMEPVRFLFREYAASLDFNFCFQSFEKELTELPGPYAPPFGCLLLASVENEPAGFVALKKLADGVCEMNRLYVRPQYQGIGLGRLLAERVIQEARRLGYQAIRLHTLPARMPKAAALYHSLGFQDIPAYGVNPVPGAVFMELPLSVILREES